MQSRSGFLVLLRRRKCARKLFVLLMEVHEGAHPCQCPIGGRPVLSFLVYMHHLRREGGIARIALGIQPLSNRTTHACIKCCHPPCSLYVRSFLSMC